MRRVLLIPLIALLSCSGGSPPIPPPVPADNVTECLTWVQPPQYVDNTTLDLCRGISWYEVHLDDDGVFGDNTVVAAVAGVDNVGQPEDEFTLTLLESYGISHGVAGCFVTVRSISSDNVKSDFGKACWWEGHD